MNDSDRIPSPGAPMTNIISQFANNRLGAVYSALYGFWSARHTAATAGARRDAYSVILFNSGSKTILSNDLTSSPDELLGAMLGHQADGGTNFSEALRAGRVVMKRNWDTDRLVFKSRMPLARFIDIYCDSERQS